MPQQTTWGRKIVVDSDIHTKEELDEAINRNSFIISPEKLDRSENIFEGTRVKIIRDDNNDQVAVISEIQDGERIGVDVQRIKEHQPLIALMEKVAYSLQSFC